LRDDPKFRATMRQRFLEKRHGWKLLGIFVRVGLKGDFTKVFDGWELPDWSEMPADEQF